MALNYNCQAASSFYFGPNCPPMSVGPAAISHHHHHLPPLPADVLVKDEPHDDDVTSHADDAMSLADGDDAAEQDSASSHDVIKADLGPPPKEVPTGRTVLGIAK